LAEVVSSGSSAIRVIGLLRRDRQQNAFAKRNSNAISKEVNLKRGNSTAITQGPPAQQAQKAAGRSAFANTRCRLIRFIPSILNNHTVSLATF
jgi:hypothetical protein